jgi:hypothetical protein
MRAFNANTPPPSMICLMGGIWLFVIARLVRNCALGRAIQYSRDSRDRTDGPRRTGYPACAGYDNSSALREQSVFPSRIKRFCPSGKSLLLFRNRVKPPKQKYFASNFCKSELQLRRLIPEEGRWPSSPSVGMGCGGRGQRQAFLAPDETLFAYGKVVWSWRRDAGAKLCGTFP